MEKKYINKLKVLHTDIGLTGLPYKESWRDRLSECVRYFESLQKELEAVKAENERLKDVVEESCGQRPVFHKGKIFYNQPKGMQTDKECPKCHFYLDCCKCEPNKLLKGGE